MNLELYFEIQNLLYHEAYLLDHRLYKEWLELLADDIEYRMPMRVTTETKKLPDIADDSMYFHETKTSLSTRVQRLYTNSAWIEETAPRQRHFVSNIVIAPASSPDELKVRSYLQFHRSRASDKEIEILSCEREDVFRKVNGEWKLASRTIYPDQAVLNVMNLGMFL
jgi:3-phenylpropionate/cinnamic acid dioxygenase small subunit